MKWLPVVGYEGKYNISDAGDVESLLGKVPRIMKQPINSVGYPQVTLSFDGKTKTLMTHLLVAAAFLGPRPPGMVVCHNDGNPQNNCINNLRYDTQTNNMRDQRNHGTNVNMNKTHCPSNHPYDNENTYQSPSGQRFCRTCNREAVRRYKGRQL